MSNIVDNLNTNKVFWISVVLMLIVISFPDYYSSIVSIIAIKLQAIKFLADVILLTAIGYILFFLLLVLRGIYFKNEIIEAQSFLRSTLWAVAVATVIFVAGSTAAGHVQLALGIDATTVPYTLVLITILVGTKMVFSIFIILTIIFMFALLPGEIIRFIRTEKPEGENKRSLGFEIIKHALLLIILVLQSIYFPFPEFEDRDIEKTIILSAHKYDFGNRFYCNDTDGTGVFIDPGQSRILLAKPIKSKITLAQIMFLQNSSFAKNKIARPTVKSCDIPV